jgi:hypothetical protein
LERAIEPFEDYCNNGRYAKSLSNLILVDVLFGRVQEALIRSGII